MKKMEYLMLKKYKPEESINIKDIKTYILDYISKYHGQGNILALSGEWGGGKTYFWQNHIAPNISNEKDLDKQLYISLYGIQSIDKIENIIATKVNNLLEKINQKMDPNVGQHVHYLSVATSDFLKKITGIDSAKLKEEAIKEISKKILKEKEILIEPSD
jgi:tRNA A37 N6-isopentenylltransferase MiaA